MDLNVMLEILIDKNFDQTGNYLLKLVIHCFHPSGLD